MSQEENGRFDARTEHADGNDAHADRQNADENQSDENHANVNRRTFLRATGVAGAATLSGVASGSPGGEPDAHESEVLVGVSEDATDVTGVVAGHLPTEAEVVHENETLSYAVVSLPDEAADRARERFVAAITQKPDVRYAEPNETYEALYAPDDPKFGDQYAPQQVGADAAWDRTLGDSDVTVAVVDSGVQYDHPDLAGNFRSDPGYDFVNDDTDPYPDDPSSEDHGTHVAGVAAAGTDDGTGIAGLSQSTLVNARVLNEDGYGTASNIADGIQWAADQGADVINLSLGGGDSTAIADAVSYAYEQGALLVAAAGNRGRDVSRTYPAAYSEVVAVSALDPDGSFSSSSNYGDEIELAAPGTNVHSTVPTDGYADKSGTTTAAPVVSGVAALAAAQWDLSNRDLRRHLTNTATDVGLPSSEQGSGRVDAADAVSTVPGRLVEDFEDGDLSEYEFDRGPSGANVVSSPTHTGSHALEYAGGINEAISTSGLPNYPQAGDTFTCRVLATNGTENVNFTYGVQDHENRYYVSVNLEQDSFRIFKTENGSGQSIDGTAGVGLTADEWHEIEIQWQRDGTHVASLYDSSGTQLVQLDVTDDTWTSGGIGFDAYLSDGEAVYFDDVQIKPSQTLVVDDFEDGDLSEYEFDRGPSGANVVSSPTYTGSHALEYAGGTNEAISTSGLEYYPQAGDTIRYRIRGTNGTENANFTYGVQDHENRYYVNVDLDDGDFRIFKYENGSGQSIDGSGALGLTADEWYEVEIQWRTDGTHVATLYDSSRVQVEQLVVTEETWTSGGIGFDAYLSDGEAVQFDDVTVELSETTVLENFEDGDVAGYSGNTPGYEVQSSTAIEGSYSLEATSTYPTIGHSHAETPRGHEYRCRIRPGSGTDTEPSLLVCAQDSSNALDDTYWAFPDASSGTFKLIRRDGGSATVLDSVSHELQAGVTYEIAVELGEDTVKAVLYDESGEVAAETATVTDTTYSGGTFGFYTGGGDTPAYYDLVTQTPLDGT